MIFILEEQNKMNTFAVSIGSFLQFYQGKLNNPRKAVEATAFLFFAPSGSGITAGSFRFSPVPFQCSRFHPHTD